MAIASHRTRTATEVQGLVGQSVTLSPNCGYFQHFFFLVFPIGYISSLHQQHQMMTVLSFFKSSSAFRFPVWTSYSVCATSVPISSIKVGFFCLFLPEQFPHPLSVCVYHFRLLVDPAKLFTVPTVQLLLISICFLTLNSWRSWRWKDETNKIMTIWEVIKQETPLHCDWKEMSGCQPSELFHMNQAIMGLFFVS